MMLGRLRRTRVFAYPQPVDMRKSFNTLSALIGQQEELLEGDAYLFVSRNRKRAKVLWFDGTGICLLSKRLEKSKFACLWGRRQEVVLTANELWLFIEGCTQLGKIELSPPEYNHEQDGRVFENNFKKRENRSCQSIKDDYKKRMRIQTETDIEALKVKAIILEKENERLSKRISELIRENIELRGANPKQLEIMLSQLDGELKKIAGEVQSINNPVTRPGSSERLNRSEKPKSREPQKGHGPRSQGQLTIIDEDYDVDEADKQCPICGEQLEEWEGAEDESEVIDVIQRQFIIRRRRRKKHRCRNGCCVETGIAPPLLIPGGRYAPGFALESLMMKYVDNIPLNRQSQIFRREGLETSRTTLWDQHWAFVCKVKPAIKRLKEYLLSQPVLGADESPWPFIMKGGRQKWQAWSITCPIAMLIEIHPTKSAEAGVKLLEGYSGKLIADGASVYEKLRKEMSFRLYNCWSHARRTFIKAEDTDPVRVKIFLEMTAELFQIEKEVFPDGVEGKRRSLEELDRLRQVRQSQSKAVIQKMHKWLAEQKALPESNFGKALKYMAKRWNRLTGFLEDPEIPLTNNRTERSYIDLACGRRSFDGCRSMRGAIAAGTMYSLIGSAKLCGLEPRDYLKIVMDAILEKRTIPLPHDLIEK